MRTINREYKEIAVGLLIPHEMNPNRGDEKVIAESVDVNGFYGAVTVRDHPTLAGRYQILAGEHRWKTATAAGSDTVPCIIVDADDDVHAARVMLVDNEAAKRSTYDAGVLTQVLKTIGSVEGTGFQLAELAAFEEERLANEPPEEDPVDFVREYGVVIIADDESHQQELYEELRGRGLQVRVASI